MNHPLSLRVKFCGRRGLQGGTPGQNGPRPPRRAHVSRSTLALRLRAGSGDSGLSPGFRRKAVRGAHPRAVPQPPTAPSPAVRAVGGARAGAWPGTRPRPERGARTSSRQRNYRASPCVRTELISGGLPSYSSSATTGGFLSESAGVGARAVRSLREGERTGERDTGHHRRGPARARAHGPWSGAGSAPSGAGLSERERAQ